MIMYVHVYTHVLVVFTYLHEIGKVQTTLDNAVGEFYYFTIGQ